MENNLFSTYISKRKVTQEEIKELHAYPNAVVTTTVWGVKGLAPTLNSNFEGQEFQEFPFDGNLTEREKVQVLDGYARYWVKVEYVERIALNGQIYAAIENWGGMYKYA